MRQFSFTLWLADDPRDVDDWSHALYEAGGSDSTCGISNGRLFAAFDREAVSLEDAIRSAHGNVATAGLRVVRCEMEVEDMAAWATA
jgi:hypothetical protein